MYDFGNPVVPLRVFGTTLGTKWGSFGFDSWYDQLKNELTKLVLDLGSAPAANFPTLVLRVQRNP